MTEDSRQAGEWWQQKLRFFRMDDASVAALRLFRPVVESNFDRIIDAFYDHIGQFDSPSRKTSRIAKLEKLKALQKGHWLKIFEANFDRDYKKELRRIGRLHYQAGVGPSRLLGGYAYIGAELLALAHREDSGLFKGRNLSVANLERALMQIMLLNSQTALTVYFKARTHERVQLVRSLVERMEQEAGNSIIDIGHLTQGVTDAAAELTKTAERSSEMANTVASATAEVLASAQTVASATEELHNSISEIARQVDQSRATSAKAVAITADGARAINALSATVDSIGSVVDVISAIAQQTHMLALNASIEASRSGEAGRGFAVVAQEVRDLAARTTDATRQIAQQIGAVRSQTHDAVAAIKASGATLNGLDEAAASIASAIEEQSAATQEIARSVGENAAAARQVSEMVEELKSSSALTSNLSKDLHKDGDRINATVGILKNTLTRVARTASPDADRRQSVRHGVLFDAQVGTGADKMDCVITNLSDQGCAVTLGQPNWREGAVVVLDCAAVGRQVRATVIKANSGMGHLRFDDALSADHIDKLAMDGAQRITKRAMQDHRAFMENIYAAMEGRGATKAADLANHHTCRLGKWYDAVSDSGMRSCPSYPALADPHHRVHAFGKKALQALAQGDRDGANAAAAEARRASEEVLHLLERLGGELTDKRGGGADNVIELRRAG